MIKWLIKVNIILLYLLFSDINSHASVDTTIQRAIRNGVTFFNSSTDQQSIIMLLPLVDMLEKNYHLGIVHHVHNVNRDIYLAHEYWLAGFNPILNHSAPPENLPEIYKDDLLNYVMFISFNCRLYKADPIFFEKLNQTFINGGYELTHAFLCLKWLEENRCTLENKAIAQQVLTLKKRYWKKLLYLAKKEPNKDLKYEAVAVALHLEKKTKLDAEIQAILREQHADGSWYNYGMSDASREHTTLLAVWALAEWANPQIKASWRQ